MIGPRIALALVAAMGLWAGAMLSVGLDSAASRGRDRNDTVSAEQNERVSATDLLPSQASGSDVNKPSL